MGDKMLMVDGVEVNVSQFLRALAVDMKLSVGSGAGGYAVPGQGADGVTGWIDMNLEITPMAE